MKLFQNIGKFIILLILSMVQSFNYINHIPFILLYIYHLNNINFSTYIHLVFGLVIYDISKYFIKIYSVKMMRLIGIHEYLSFSLGLLIITQIGFSILFYYYKHLFIFILYRIFLSLFNNLSSNITFPISRLYNNKKINKRMESFSFYQKFFNFLIFPISIFILTDLNSFSYFCLLLSIINIICFIIYLIVFLCNNNQNEKVYYPQISEKVQYKKNHNLNLIKEQNNKNSKKVINKIDINKLKTSKNNINSENYGDNTNLGIISGEIKNKLFLNNKNNRNNNIKININQNHEGSINFCKNISEIDNNKGIKNNFNDNSLKNRLYQKNNTNINNSEIINKIESSSDVALGQFYGENKNKPKMEINYNNSYQKQISFQASNNQQNNHISNNINININIDKNIIQKNSLNNKKSFKNKNKRNIPISPFVYLILIHSIFKFINYLTIFLHLFIFFESKNFLNDKKINFINSAFVEIMILFSLYYFINMILSLINRFLALFIIKGGCFMKYFIFYLFQFFYFISLIIFIILFLNKKFFIRKNIILSFVFGLIISEISMILLIYYNKIALNRGLNQHFLKETKSLGILFGAILFIIFSSFRGILLYIIKIKINFFDIYFLSGTFLIFFITLFIIGFVF